mmetsp:Transcript_24472/g.75487  ORF Transcript_24472/g.75487 Transcript_24472/m.75487 type:complete len:263 (-) Transcript_24472:990-1778(-)
MINTSSILRIILTTCVASWTCCCLPINVSKTFCCFMSLVPFCMQSTPRYGFPSATCFAFTAVSSVMGDRPEFSANAMGTSSKASANARIAYCAWPSVSSAAFDTAIEHATSAAPPPYTMRLSLTKLRTTHMASWSDRFASSTIILLPPRTKIVTASDDAQSSMTSMRSFVVPNDTSRTMPAFPSFSADNSEKRGTMRPPVAIAMSSNSTPPTQRTAGSSACNSKWFASSSKPHWQMTKFAPQSLHCWTISPKYACSRLKSLS